MKNITRGQRIKKWENSIKTYEDTSQIFFLLVEGWTVVISREKITEEQLGCLLNSDIGIDVENDTAKKEIILKLK